VDLRPVTVLRYETDRILVTQGLHAGERVVTAGVHKLWPGIREEDLASIGVSLKDEVELLNAAIEGFELAVKKALKEKLSDDT